MSSSSSSSTSQQAKHYRAIVVPWDDSNPPYFRHYKDEDDFLKLVRQVVGGHIRLWFNKRDMNCYGNDGGFSHGLRVNWHVKNALGKTVYGQVLIAGENGEGNINLPDNITADKWHTLF